MLTDKSMLRDAALLTIAAVVTWVFSVAYDTWWPVLVWTAVYINLSIGVEVLTRIDDEERTILKWLRGKGSMLKVLFYVSLWPIIVHLWRKRNSK